jgi:hypothetical protein
MRTAVNRIFVAGLVIASGAAVGVQLTAQDVRLTAQDVPPAVMACISDGTKVGHTYLQHSEPAKLAEAVKIYQQKTPDAEYPEGTVFRLIPGEAMVKRTHAAFPNSNGWEYFALTVNAQGTTVRARGDEASNRIGTCQSCHTGAAKSDYICSAGTGCPTVPLTEEQIAQIQKNDPRCAK